MKIDAETLRQQIKRLEWSEESPPDAGCHYSHVTAFSPIGTWQIEWKEWKESDWFCVYLFSEIECPQVASAPTLRSAKALAQKLFEEKILQCLEVQKNENPI